MAQAPEAAFTALAGAGRVRITEAAIETDHGVRIAFKPTEARRMALAPRDEAMLSGREGEARRLAMGIILRLAETFGAPGLIDVTRAHLDCCIHTGPASVAVAEKLRDLGGRFAVPTTLNAISTDLQRWGALGFDAHVAGESRRQADAYVAMGARPTFTCAPYLEDAPQAGEQIAWAESNASPSPTACWARGRRNIRTISTCASPSLVARRWRAATKRRGGGADGAGGRSSRRFRR